MFANWGCFCCWGVVNLGFYLIMKYAIAQENDVNITKGKRYEIIISGSWFDFKDDAGDPDSHHVTNKNWIITDMKTTQEELDELKLEQIEQDKKIARLEEKLKEKQGPLFVPKSGDRYYYLETCLSKGVEVDSMTRGGGSHKAPQFREESTAQGFAEAINILLEWNMCEGRVEVRDDTYQYFASFDIDPVGHQALRFKPLNMSVFFDTKENCQASIDKIGKERIMKMRRGLHLMGK